MKLSNKILEAVNRGIKFDYGANAISELHNFMNMEIIMHGDK